MAVTISAKEVKALRDITGAGMMDCKRALVKAEGDAKEAEKILKELGKAAVAKRSDRATDNGRISIRNNGKAVAMVEISCETDFVASNDKFAELGNDVCDRVLEKGFTEPNEELDGMVKNVIAIIKENMKLTKVYYRPLKDNEYAATYVHGNGVMGVVVVFSGDKAEIFENEQVKEFTNDIALHVAAFTPAYLNEKAIPADYIAEQKEIFTAQVASMDKPEKVKEGIIRGKLNKHLSQVCLIKQGFVKEEAVSVEKKMAAIAKAAGGKLAIEEFNYFVTSTK